MNLKSSCHWMLLAGLGVLSACANMQTVSESPAAAPEAASSSVPAPAAAPAAAQSAPAARQPEAAADGVQVKGQLNDTPEASVATQISNKLRAHLRLPKGVFPKNAEVVIEAALAPNGNVLAPRVARSSGYKSLDEAVLRALQKSQPLPVPAGVRDADQSMPIRLVFRPLQPK